MMQNQRIFYETSISRPLYYHPRDYSDESSDCEDNASSLSSDTDNRAIVVKRPNLHRYQYHQQANHVNSFLTVGTLLPVLLKNLRKYFRKNKSRGKDVDNIQTIMDQLEPYLNQPAPAIMYNNRPRAKKCLPPPPPRRDPYIRQHILNDWDLTEDCDNDRPLLTTSRPKSAVNDRTLREIQLVEGAGRGGRRERSVSVETMPPDVENLLIGLVEKEKKRQSIKGRPKGTRNSIKKQQIQKAILADWICDDETPSSNSPEARKRPMPIMTGQLPKKRRKTSSDNKENTTPKSGPIKTSSERLDIMDNSRKSKKSNPLPRKSTDQLIKTGKNRKSLRGQIENNFDFTLDSSGSLDEGSLRSPQPANVDNGNLKVQKPVLKNESVNFIQLSAPSRPDNCNVRRSNRIKVPPLKYWQGERLVNNPDGSTVIIGRCSMPFNQSTYTNTENEKDTFFKKPLAPKIKANKKGRRTLDPIVASTPILPQQDKKELLIRNSLPNQRPKRMLYSPRKYLDYIQDLNQ